ncbi:hypothetical protein D6D23_09854, partial [Aureobasidium pullulans]
MRSTGYAESQSESPNRFRFGSDAARDDSTVFDHDDSGSPVRNQRQEDHNQSISPPLSEACLSCGERPSDEALLAHGESSGGIRRLSRSFSNFSLKDNRVVHSKTTGNFRPPFSLMRHHIRTGSQASKEELLPRGTIPGRSGGSLQVATQSLGGQEPSFWDDALSNRNAANLGGSQPPAGTSGPQLSSLPPFDSFFNAVLPFQPQRSSWLGLSTLSDSSQTATTTGQSTLEPVTETEEPRSSVDIKESTNLTWQEDAAPNLDPGPDLRSDFTGRYDPNFVRQRPQTFLNPSMRPPPPAYSRDPLPGAKYFAKSQRQYDLVADLHRELDDEARPRMMEIKRLLSSLSLPTPILITLFKVKTWQKKSSG